MTDQELQLPWTQPGWFEQASAWIHDELERQGIAVNGPIQQPHIRPWSTVLRVPTGQGDLFFKATAPALAHEPALTQALWGWRPDCIPEVLAVDSERGWLLMRDSGASLRSLLQSDPDIGRWRTVVRKYAEVQLELSNHRAQLLSLGALDRRLAVLPAHYTRLLADSAALHIDAPNGLTADEYRRLNALAPRFEAMCTELATYGVPETLHHDDFHDGNIFVRDGAYVFADWAESCVAHPFFTLVVALRSVENTLGLEDDAPELAALRHDYLESWLRYGSRPDLLTAFTLAQRIGMVCRALTWRHVTASLPEPDKAEYAAAVPGWLQEFLTAETDAAG